MATELNKASGILSYSGIVARSATLADDTYEACLEISHTLEKLEKKRISIDMVVRFLITTSTLTEVKQLKPLSSSRR